MEQSTKNIFRNQVVEKISSPEQLSNYLRVTDPGVWVALTSIVLLLVGLLIWASVGTLETTVEAKVIVEDRKAQIFLSDNKSAEPGMSLRVVGEETVITSVEADPFGRTLCYAELFLPDGTYDGVVVLEQTRPISFLFESH